MKTATTSKTLARVLGLAIMAALAMSVLLAASAQAADPEIHCTSTTNTCTVTGAERNTHAFNIEGGNIRCRASFTATLNTKTMSTISGVTASYTGCRLFGVAATVNMNGCTYTFTNVSASNPATATLDIVCPAGNSIVLNAPSLPCTTTYGPQTGLAHVVLSNGGGAEPTDIVANFTVSGVNYNKAGVACPEGTGNKSNGTLNGETTLEGFNDSGPNGGEGNKVGLHVKPL